MVLSLTGVAIVAAALLGFMHDVTAEPIRQIEQQNLENGIKKVILGSADAQESIRVEESSDGDFYFYKAFNDKGEQIGTAVKTAVQGFSPALTILAGFDTEGNILGYDVLSHSETPGLGANVVTWFQPSSKGNVIGKNPGKDNLTVKKDGGDVDAITASTITSRAFLRAINLEYSAIFGGGETNGNTGASNVQNND